MIYLYTIGLLLFIIIAWQVVQSVASRFAQHHPEFGPARRMGLGCCGKCENNTCEKEHGNVHD